jgi:hypothetical protein
VLFYTGIRLGEALVLRWDDVDLDARTLLSARLVCAGRGYSEGPPLPRRAARAASGRGGLRPRHARPRKLSTTDRYVAAKYRPEEFARLDAAFARHETSDDPR